MEAVHLLLRLRILSIFQRHHSQNNRRLQQEDGWGRSGSQEQLKWPSTWMLTFHVFIGWDWKRVFVIIALIIQHWPLYYFFFNWICHWLSSPWYEYEMHYFYCYTVSWHILTWFYQLLFPLPPPISHSMSCYWLCLRIIWLNTVWRMVNFSYCSVTSITDSSDSLAWFSSSIPHHFVYILKTFAWFVT